MATPSPAVQAVLSALEALYKNPERAAKENANAWLQSFQAQTEAWETANVLLLAQDLPVEPRLFAAQTFRTKIMFDLEQVPAESRLALRSTLLTALTAYLAGPRVIQTQLCVALAALALQLPDGADPEWGDRVVPAMIERYGGEASSVGVLLEFLTTLPEEVTTNHRIPVDNEQYNARHISLLTTQTGEVLRVLSMYIQAQGITPQIQNAVFACLRSWVRSGEISASALLETPLFQLSFDALQSDTLFDVAVDVLCDIINETQEVEESMRAIQLIVERLLPLRADLTRAIADEDEDKVRGLCRLYVAAGETYHHLVLKHKAEFFPIVEAIAQCAAYTDVEIVQITFRFWYMLAMGLGKARSSDPEIKPFLDVFERIYELIIRLLRWPDEALSSSDTADHRELRHHLGDTLKDCCHVLGAQECLARSLQMIEELLAHATSAGEGGGPKWQDIEAPLFSMRAMGREADMLDNNVTPRIMDIVAALPDHPKVKYAGLLVVGRYTEWVAAHPERIQGILSYVSSGLQGAQLQETGAAAAQAMKFLCQDCARHLVPYLPQLYDFYHTVTASSLPAPDLLELTEALAFVVAASDDVPPTVLHFLKPLLESLGAFAAAGGEKGKEEVQKACVQMEQIQVFLATTSEALRGREVVLAPDCTKTCSEAFGIVDRIVEQYGASNSVAERACHLIRRSMAFFGELARPVIPAVIARMGMAFQATGQPGYVWITGKCIDQYSYDADAQLQMAMKEGFDRVGSKCLEMLEVVPPSEMGEILDDYLNACTQITLRTAGLLLASPAFPHVFRAALTALTLQDMRVVSTAIEFINELLSHDALTLPVGAGQAGVALPAQPQTIPPGQEAYAYAEAIRAVVASQGYQLATLLLTGFVSSFQSDQMPPTMTAFRLLSLAFPRELVAWAPAVAEQLPTSTVPVQERVKFVESITNAINNGAPVKSALQGLYAASRKARERARVDRDGGLFDVDR